jgi:hypothetical protein
MSGSHIKRHQRTVAPGGGAVRVASWWAPHGKVDPPRHILDTFARRGPDTASRLHNFEIDRHDQQTRKGQRLIALGFAILEWLRFMPVDLEARSSR